MNISFINKSAAVISILLLSTLFNLSLAAKPVTDTTLDTASPLAGDLQALLVEATALNTQLESTTLTDTNMCSELLNAHVSADSLINNIEAVNAGLSAPISIDVDSMQALDNLSAMMVTIAGNSTSLSSSISTLNNTTDMLAISSALNSMLRLADDIGTMADRILEMSDKILVMADNIGLMADRIIITQQIQSDNLALTQSSILTTQQNSIAMFRVINTSTYSADINSQTSTGNFLAFDIGATFLTTFNLASQWSGIATDVASLKAQVETTHAAITAASVDNTMYIDAAGYADLAEMNIMISSVAIAVEGLALASEGLSPITGDVTLSDSMGSILQLSTDIGIMADRILEMADLILAMSDNIGMTADQIIAAQSLQSTNYAATLASVEATQGIAITVIAINAL